MLPQFVDHLFFLLKVSLTELDDVQTEKASLKHIYYKMLITAVFTNSSIMIKSLFCVCVCVCVCVCGENI